MSYLVRQLWLLYTIDPSILSKCKPKERRQYTIYGALVFIVLVISYFSGLYLSFLITDNLMVSIITGLFLSWNFSNLYRLILLTIKPRDGRTPIGNQTTFLIRGVFIVVLLIAVIKPIELKLFEPQIEHLLSDYKEERKRKLNSDWLGFINQEIEEFEAKNLQLENEIEEAILLLDSPEGVKLQESTQNSIVRNRERIQNNDEHILYLIETRQNYIVGYEQHSQNARYVIQRFKLLFVNIPISWLFTIILGGILLLPIIMKRYFFKNHYYFKLETYDEKSLIQSHYGWFKTEYQKVLFQATGISSYFHEAYEDAPYNKVKIRTNISFKEDEEFNQWITSKTDA